MSYLVINFLLVLSATYVISENNRENRSDNSASAKISLPQQQRQQQQLPSNFRPAKQINSDQSKQSANEKQSSGTHDEIMARMEELRRLQQAPVSNQFISTKPTSQINLPNIPENSQSDSVVGVGVTTGQLPPVDKSVDLDGDGILSLTEVQYAAFVHHGLSSNVIESLFKEVDKNGDGYLTSIEFNDIRPLVLAKAESAAQRYLQTVDKNHNGLLSLQEAKEYILKEYGIGNRDIERVWYLVVPSKDIEMDANMFSKLRRRIRAMSIRLARIIMKEADKNEDGHINKREAQKIAFEQEGISADDANEMLISVDDNNDSELNAPEFADFQRIIRSRAVETSKKALKVVDRDGSGTVTMNEAKRIAFDHYGFDEKILAPFFAQADENEDGQLDPVEFAGFRTLIRGKAVKNALDVMQEIDNDGDGYINSSEAATMARRQDDMDPKETLNLFAMADQDKSGKLDKVELADFLRLVRLSAIKFATDHFKDFDMNKDKTVTVDELEEVIELKYKVDRSITRKFFKKVDVDNSGDLTPGELVDFRHEIRRFVAERNSQRLNNMNKSTDQGAKNGGNTEEVITNSDIRKQQSIMTKSPKAEINAGKRKESVKENNATELLSQMLTTTTINTIIMHSIDQSQQFSAEEKMQFEQPEVDIVNDGDISSINVSSNTSSNESMKYDGDNKKGIEQDLILKNDENDKRELQLAMIDVTTIEAIESESQSIQEQGKSGNKIESETNSTEVDDMMDTETNHEDMKQQAVAYNASVTSSKANTAKKIVGALDKSISAAQKSKVKMTDTLADDQEKETGNVLSSSIKNTSKH